MKYILLMTCLALSLSAMAGEKKTVQEKSLSDEYQYGAKDKEKPAKTGKLSDKDEFEVAPRQ